jgi:hypothetical protein
LIAWRVIELILALAFIVAVLLNFGNVVGRYLSSLFRGL